MTELAVRPPRQAGRRRGEHIQLTLELNLTDYMMLLREGHPEWACAERMGTTTRVIDRWNAEIRRRAANEAHPDRDTYARALRCLREVRARYS